MSGAATRPPEVVVIGAGYVGLTLALFLAARDFQVLAVDIDEPRIAALRSGRSPVFEQGIEAALERCLATGRVTFTTQRPEAAPVWIAAHSYAPGDPEGYLRAFDGVRGVNGQPPLVMIRGTTPVGYTSTYVVPALEKRLEGPVDDTFWLVNAPERTLSGAALDELARLPQLLGGSAASVRRAAAVYEQAGVRCLALPSFEAAELAKVFTNFSRMAQFNLANFLGVLCHEWQVSEASLIAAMREGYPRLDFLSAPGPGVGGFCLPKDSLVLHDGLAAREGRGFGQWFADHPRQAHALNERVIAFHVERVCDLVDGAARVLAVGIAFKGDPPTGDTRGSVGLEIVRALAVAGVDVRVYDRVVGPEALTALGLRPAAAPLSLADVHALLLLNNDRGYRDVIAAAVPPGEERTVRLYDPWRLVVAPGETIFQRAWALRRAGV